MDGFERKKEDGIDDAGAGYASVSVVFGLSER